MSRPVSPSLTVCLRSPRRMSRPVSPSLTVRLRSPRRMRARRPAPPRRRILPHRRTPPRRRTGRARRRARAVGAWGRTRAGPFWRRCRARRCQARRWLARRRRARRCRARRPGRAVLAPPDGGSGAGTDERPEEQEAALKRRVSRRTLLQASLIGGAGVAALPLLAVVGGITRPGEPPAGLVFSMNTNWLFGGQYTSGSESSFFDDSNFAPVAVPHTVTRLSWQNWDYPAWQQVWIYRRHFNGWSLLDRHRPGNRILVDFEGVMVNATVAINDQVVSTHQGGYLPFSAELTGKVTGGDNLLAVVVDSRCLPVPPVGLVHI